MKYYFISYFYETQVGMAPYTPFNDVIDEHPFIWHQTRKKKDLITLFSWQEIDEETFKLHKK